MIETVNEALLQLQGALSARSLYPPGHPRICAGEERACELLRDALRSRDEITVFAVEERVIFDGNVLPGSSTLVETLFRPLSQNGIDRITFRRGVEGGEVRELLDRLAGADGGQRDLVETPHLGFGYIHRPGPWTGLPALPREEAASREMAGALSGVWEGIFEAASLDANLLGDIVSCVSRVVSESASAMLPLAAIKKHDEYTFVHTINVAILSTALGEALGYQGRVAHELNMAALLHDVGKRLIPKELLEKNARFTDEEYRLVQEHPVTGARLLLVTPGVPPLAPIVAYEHHVRADGSGYPKIPPGWKLNLASRIVQIADVFDALRTDRPYRPALPLEEVIQMMRKDVGVFFDADLLEVFLRQVIFRRVGEPPPESSA